MWICSCRSSPFIFVCLVALEATRSRLPLFPFHVFILAPLFSWGFIIVRFNYFIHLFENYNMSKKASTDGITGEQPSWWFQWPTLTRRKRGRKGEGQDRSGSYFWCSSQVEFHLLVGQPRCMLCSGIFWTNSSFSGHAMTWERDWDGQSLVSFQTSSAFLNLIIQVLGCCYRS